MLRKNLIQTKIYKAVLWMVIIAMLGIWSIPSFFKSSDPGYRSIGSVDSIRLWEPDFKRKIASQKEQLQLMRMQYGQYAEELMQAMGYNMDPAHLAIKSMIDDTLLQQVAETIGITVHQDYIQQSLGNIFGIYQFVGDLIPLHVIDRMTGEVNEKALRSYLRNSGLTMDEFNEKIEEALQRKLVSQLLLQTAYIPKFELERAFNAEFLPKTCSIVKISYESMLAQAKKEKVSQEALAAFYESHKNNYWVPEKRSAQAWLITPQDYGITIAEEDITAYYNDHKMKNFVAEPPRVQVRKIFFNAENTEDMANAQRRAEEALARFKEAPDTFAQEAKTLSQDADTAKRGGLMEPFAKGDVSVDRALERASFLLQNVGDISNPIVVKDGVALVQLVQKTPRVFKELKDVREEIISKLIDKKFAKQFVSDMKKMQTQGGVDQITSYIAGKNKKSRMHELITKDNSPLSQAMFASKGDEYTFYVSENQGYVIKVTHVQESYLPELDAIKDVVTTDFYEDQARIALKNQLEAIKLSAQDTSMKEAAQSKGLSVKQIADIDKHNAERIETFKKEGLPVDAMLEMQRVGSIEITMNDNNGYVIRLDEVSKPEEGLFEAKKEELFDRLKREVMPLISNGFVASLHRNAKINLNL